MCIRDREFGGREAVFSRVVVEPPKDSSHGELATNAAMVLAKPLGVKPGDLAGKIAERLRAAVADEPLTLRSLDGKTAAERVTASIGGALYPSGGRTVRDLWNGANRLLLEAKANGKNQVALAGHGRGEVKAGRSEPQTQHARPADFVGKWPHGEWPALPANGPDGPARAGSESTHKAPLAPPPLRLVAGAVSGVSAYSFFPARVLRRCLIVSTRAVSATSGAGSPNQVFQVS